MENRSRSGAYDVTSLSSRYYGPELNARLYVADRLARAAADALIAEAARGTRRTRPVAVRLGGMLVRMGERLEAAGGPRRAGEYA